MARPYSLDLRERVVRAVEVEGLSRRAAAVRFGLAVSTVIKWASDSKKPVTTDRDGLQVTLVAGIGFEPMTFGL